MKHLKQLAQFSLSQSIEIQKYVLFTLEEISQIHNDVDIFYLAGLYSANFGMFDKSIFYYKKCLEINPNEKNALFDLGAIHIHLGKWIEGIEYGEKLYSVDKDFKSITQHLANSYSQIGMFPKASEYFKESLEINPNNLQLWSDYFLSLNYTNFSIDERKTLQSAIQKTQLQNNVFPKLNRKNKIRIGYVSSDFRNHAVTYFYKGLITHHNRDIFDVYFYSTNSFQDSITEIFKTSGDFKSIEDSETLYQTIKQDDIDILVDLNGYTRGNKLDVFIHNPSPIQVSWIGFLNSMYLSSIQYKITDRNLIDESIKDYYTESLITLSNCLLYDPPNNCPHISPSPYEINGYLTFGFFNNFRKLNDDVLDTWVSILLSHKNCKFVVMKSDFQEQIEYVISYLNQRGFDNIEVLNNVDIREFMECIGSVDVCLDPFYHVGGVTTAHSLWMGVPVLTLEGNLESERISSALLKNVGLDSFIAKSKDEYILKGIEIPIHKLKDIRNNIRHMFPKREDVLNELEMAFTTIYNQHL